MYRNGEGYNDPTAGMAIRNAEKYIKEKREEERRESLVYFANMIKQAASLIGLEFSGPIKLRDKVTGKRYEI